MTTRPGAANLALRAKQELVRILHGHTRYHDQASYSFRDLKRAFLRRAHEIHPDKQQQQQQQQQMMPDISAVEDTTGHDNTVAAKEKCRAAVAEFIALKEAWIRYEKTAKITTGLRSKQNKEMSGSQQQQHQQQEGSFTMFGVGCSFSDNDMERQQRTKIMDEAARGWFSAGEISNGGPAETAGMVAADDDDDGDDNDDSGAPKGSCQRTSAATRLASDDLFEKLPERVDDVVDSGCRIDTIGTGEAKQLPSLVSHLLSKPKRK
jgi:hypothetical protein